jgi:DNA-binding NarL/FixJ family response regulator
VVLDRYPVWLDAIGAVVTGSGFEQVEMTTKPDVALRLVQSTQPGLHVVGADAFAVEAEALAHLRRARERAPQVNVLVISGNAEPARIDAAFDAGAFAYVLKTADPEDLSAAIRQATDHTLHFPGLSPGGEETAPSAPSAPGLTPREIEVLCLVAEGHSNAHLARLLWVTEQTVKFHLSNIYRKLGITNRTEASRWAQEHGFLRTAA